MLCPAFFSDYVSALWWIISWGGVVYMPLHDAVGLNCIKGSTAENQCPGTWYIAKECVLDDCVGVIWRHDYSSFIAGESHGILVLLLLLLNLKYCPQLFINFMWKFWLQQTNWLLEHSTENNLNRTRIFIFNRFNRINYTMIPCMKFFSLFCDKIRSTK